MKLTRDGRTVSLGGRGRALLAALVRCQRRRRRQGDADGCGLARHGRRGGQSHCSDRRAPPGIGSWARRAGVDRHRAARRLSARLAAGGQNDCDDGPPAVAVLPFENLSSDPEQSFLADGVVEEIITALSRFRTFAVVARNSTFAYKGRAVDVRDVARDLGVRYVLEGSVRRSGDKVRVAAQLIEGASGAHLWAEKFEGAVADIFDFQDEITQVGHRPDRAANPQGGDRARPAQAPGKPRCLGPLCSGAAAGLLGKCARIHGGHRAARPRHLRSIPTMRRRWRSRRGPTKNGRPMAGRRRRAWTTLR